MKDDIVIYLKYLFIKWFYTFGHNSLIFFEIKIPKNRNVYFTNHAFIYDCYFVSKLKIEYNKMPKITTKLETANGT